MESDETVSLASDPRWRRLHSAARRCSVCGEIHRGVFDLAFAKPEQWPESEEKVANSEVLTSSHFLSEDFCVREGTDQFVRCVLEIPILGSGGQLFAYGVWSSLSDRNFRIYRDGFDTGVYENDGPWFGWFSSHLKGYPDTRNLKCQVHPRPGRKRPWIELEPTEHPLAVEQQRGITFDRLLELYALNGHDIRQDLMDS